MMLITLALCGLLAQDDPLKGPCDQAGPLLAAGKSKEALALLQPLLKNAAGPSKDRLHYYLGLAAFSEGNDLLAGRALSRLAPFESPLYAAHARYLLGRIHHRAGEGTDQQSPQDAVRKTSVDVHHRFLGRRKGRAPATGGTRFIPRRLPAGNSCPRC